MLVYIVISILIFILGYLIFDKIKESFNLQIIQPNLVDLSKVKWDKLNDYQYSKLINQIEGRYQEPEIKNLNV
jgi:hypothetical protein